MAFAAIVGLNVKMNASDSQLADLNLANMEALASGESGSGSTCYHTITSKDGCQTKYCGTCTYISGTPSWVSGSGTC